MHKNGDFICDFTNKKHLMKNSKFYVLVLG